jgi:hypothetical protein
MFQDSQWHFTKAKSFFVSKSVCAFTRRPRFHRHQRAARMRDYGKESNMSIGEYGFFLDREKTAIIPNISTHHDMKICSENIEHIQIFKYEDMSYNILVSLYSDVTRQAVSRLFFGRHFLQPDKIPASSNPLFRPSLKNAIASKNPPCRYTSRFIPRNPAPISRNSKCKPVALCHDPS